MVRESGWPGQKFDKQRYLPVFPLSLIFFHNWGVARKQQNFKVLSQTWREMLITVRTLSNTVNKALNGAKWALEAVVAVVIVNIV